MIYSRRLGYRRRSTWPSGLATLAFFIIVCWFSINQIVPPKPYGNNDSEMGFSLNQAMAHLQQIGTSERIPGTEFHARVTSYLQGHLVALGLETEVQTVVSVEQRRNFVPFQVARVNNVVARLRGTDSSGAVILVAHYDSVPTGPGVGDDAMGVSALLETARVLSEGSALRNDVIFLFTDAHEYRLLGVRGFLEEHPWAKDVEVIFNFEGQGPNGPVFMFETSANNSWLIEQFAQAVPYPLASSLSMDVYKQLNFDNDFRVFMDHGYQGLGFAVLADMAYYHSELDNLERVEPRTLVHHGTLALGLAKHFGSIDLLAEHPDENGVYFNVLRQWLVHYSVKMVPLWAGLAVFLAIVALGVGFVRGQIKVVSLLIAVLALVFTLGAAFGLTWGLVKALGLNSRTYGATLYFGSFIALSIGLVSSMVRLAGVREWKSLAGAGLLVWAGLTVASAFLMPGASYLFTWPLVFSASGFFILVLSNIEDADGLANWIAFVLPALPALMIVVPIIWLLYLTMTPATPFVGTLLVVLLLWLVVPSLSIMFARSGWVIPAFALVVCIAFLVVALFLGEGPMRPSYGDAFYAIDADSQEAYWGSPVLSVDEWNRQFFATDGSPTPLVEILPFGFPSFLVNEAPIHKYDAPELTVIEDSVDATGVRLTELHIKSIRSAPKVMVFLAKGTTVLSSELDGRWVTDFFDPGWMWAIQYHNVPADGFQLTLRTVADKPLNLTVVDQTYDLIQNPELEIEPRPESVIKKPNNQLTDSVLVSRNYVFEIPERMNENEKGE